MMGKALFFFLDGTMQVHQVEIEDNVCLYVDGRGSPFGYDHYDRPLRKTLAFRKRVRAKEMSDGELRRLEMSYSARERDQHFFKTLFDSSIERFQGDFSFLKKDRDIYRRTTIFSWIEYYEIPTFDKTERLSLHFSDENARELLGFVLERDYAEETSDMDIKMEMEFLTEKLVDLDDIMKKTKRGHKEGMK